MNNWKKISLFVFCVTTSFAHASTRDPMDMGEEGVEAQGAVPIGIDTRENYDSTNVGRAQTPPPPRAAKTVKFALETAIEALERDIEAAHQATSAEELTSIHERFMALEVEENQWKLLADQRGCTKWKYQDSWRDSVGGYLFYPSKLVESFLDFSANKYLLGRSDVKRALEIANSYNHPISKYVYMTEIAGERCTEAFWTSTIETLLYADPAPETLRIWFAPYLFNRWFHWPSEEKSRVITRMQSFEDPASKLKLLRWRKKFKKPPLENSHPTIEDFIALGEKHHYGAAYRAVCGIFHDKLTNDEKIAYFNRAIELGDPHSLCLLAGFYDRDEAIPYLLRYAKQGFSLGYLDAMELYVNPSAPPPLKPTQDDVDKARYYAKLAIKAGDNMVPGILERLEDRLQRIKINE